MFGFYSFSHGNLFTIVESVILLSRYCYFLQSRLVNIRCLSSIVVSSVDYKRIDAHVELSNERGHRVIIRNLNGRLSAYRNWITRGLKNRIGKRGGGLRSKTRISA